MTVHTGSEADQVAAALAGAAGRHFARPATIERLKRESGGASRQTWSFDAVADGKRHGLILRRDPPTTAKAAAARARHWTGPPSFACWPPPTKAACGRRVLFELTPQDGLGEGFVMQRVDGTAIARKLLRDPPYERRGR